MNATIETGPVRPVEARLKALFVRGLDGNVEAYHAFLGDLTGYLRGFLRKRLFELQDDIEDLLQEVLLGVHNGRHTYCPDQPLTAWVHAIVRYKLGDFFGSRSRSEAFSIPLDEDLELFAARDVQAADARRDLSKLLEQLPERQRLPILLMKLEGLSVTETAKLTGLSESAVKVGVHRGFKALALKVSRRFLNTEDLF
jgi:RNA polymerase sigma-70 factor, ECF subfamily